MLAMKTRDHLVEASVPGLADLARVSVAKCREALLTLAAPDEDSRTKDYDGRRIEALEDGSGWRVLNGEKYRKKMNADERREYLRLKKQESRNRGKTKNLRQQSVNKRQQLSTVSTHTDTDTEADTDTEKDNKTPLPPFAEFIPESIDCAGLREAWTDYVQERGSGKKKVSECAAKIIMRKLERWGKQKAIVALENSIAGGWQGVFEPKEQSNGKSATRKTPEERGQFPEPDRPVELGVRFPSRKNHSRGGVDGQDERGAASDRENSNGQGDNSES